MPQAPAVRNERLSLSQAALRHPSRRERVGMSGARSQEWDVCSEGPALTRGLWL